MTIFKLYHVLSGQVSEYKSEYEPHKLVSFRLGLFWV